MTPKLVKTEIAQYAAGEWSGKNTSGIRPIGDYILVLPDQAVDKTKGGIFLPEDLNERQSMAAQSGIIVALGDGAFTWNSDRTRPFSGQRPLPGDRVHFARYSGQKVIGHDGANYLIMDDKAAAGVQQ